MEQMLGEEDERIRPRHSFFFTLVCYHQTKQRTVKCFFLLWFFRLVKKTPKNCTLSNRLSINAEPFRSLFSQPLIIYLVILLTVDLLWTIIHLDFKEGCSDHVRPFTVCYSPHQRQHETLIYGPSSVASVWAKDLKFHRSENYSINWGTKCNSFLSAVPAMS